MKCLVSKNLTYVSMKWQIIITNIGQISSGRGRYFVLLHKLLNP